MTAQAPSLDRLRTDLAAASAISNLMERIARLDALEQDSYAFHQDAEVLAAGRAWREAFAAQVGAWVSAVPDAERAALRTYLMGRAFDPVRGLLLAELDDDETFRVVLGAAGAELDGDDRVTPALFRVLVRLGAPAPRRARVLQVMRGAFGRALWKARDQERLISASVFVAAAGLLGQLGREAEGKALHDALRVAMSRHVHHELHQSVGDLAIAMAALDYQKGLDDLRAFLTDYEWRYQGFDFVMKARYACWLLSDDGADAAQFASDPEKTKGLALAAIAVADLNHQPGATVLRARQTTLVDPVSREIFAEALARLERQVKRPAPHERMIGMLGSLTGSQLALGAETDNVFVLRARERAVNPRLGEVTEADAS